LLSKEHLKTTGFIRVIALKANFKLGISELLKFSFPNFIPIDTPNYPPNLYLINIH
jgi:hypothetical protein